MSILRVTGRVVRVDSKSGTKVNEQTGEARAWGFDIIRTLVAEQDVVEVQRFRDHSTPAPAVGADVDYAVTVETFRGKPSFQLDKPWAELVPAKQTALTPVPASGRSVG